MPVELDLEIYRGDTYRLRVTNTDAAGNPIDLSGRTFAAQIRPSYDSEQDVIDFATDDSEAVDGIVTIKLTAAQTAVLPTPAGGVWDLQSTDPTGDNGDPLVETLAAGKICVTKDVTRSS